MISLWSTTRSRLCFLRVSAISWLSLHRMTFRVSDVFWATAPTTVFVSRMPSSRPRTVLHRHSLSARTSSATTPCVWFWGTISSTARASRVFFARPSARRRRMARLRSSATVSRSPSAMAWRSSMRWVTAFRSRRNPHTRSRTTQWWACTSTRTRSWMSRRVSSPPHVGSLRSRASTSRSCKAAS